MNLNVKNFAVSVALSIPFLAMGAETTLAQSSKYGSIAYSESTGATACLINQPQGFYLVFTEVV